MGPPPHAAPALGPDGEDERERREDQGEEGDQEPQPGEVHGAKSAGRPVPAKGRPGPRPRNEKGPVGDGAFLVSRGGRRSSPPAGDRPFRP